MKYTIIYVEDNGKYSVRTSFINEPYLILFKTEFKSSKLSLLANKVVSIFVVKLNLGDKVMLLFPKSFKYAE